MKRSAFRTRIVRVGVVSSPIPTDIHPARIRDVVLSSSDFFAADTPAFRRGEEPRPPRGIRTELQVSGLGVLTEPLAVFELMKANSIARRAADVHDPILRVFHDRSPLEAVAPRPAIRRSDPALSRLPPVQLPPVELQRRHAEQSLVIRFVVASDDCVGQHPGVDAVGRGQGIRQVCGQTP